MTESNAEARSQPGSALYQPFWEALRRGELVVQICRACEHWQVPAQSFCFRCGAAVVEWERVKGTGTVWSAIAVYRASSADLQKRAPYVLAIVRLQEGPFLMGFLIGVSPERVGEEQTADIDCEVHFDPSESAACQAIVFAIGDVV